MHILRAVSPFRRFAVSPFRRFAVSPFRRFAVSLIALWALSCADNADYKTNNDKREVAPVNDSVLTAQLTECPVDACVVSTYGCNHKGQAVPCVQDPEAPEGCGYYDELQFQSCGSNSFCYRGSCFSADDIAVPDEPQDPNFLSLYDARAATWAVNSQVQVIPYAAFLNALRAKNFGVATTELSNIGLDVTVHGNDPEVMGITANFVQESSFSGDVFIVPMEGVRTPGPSGSTRFESSHYFVAVVPGLSGPTSWVGTGAQFALRREVGLPSQSCCSGGGSQPKTSCGFGGPSVNPLPVPETCPTGSADCPFPWDTNLDELIQTDPLISPLRFGAGAQGTLNFSGMTLATIRRGDQQPAVYLYASTNILAHENAIQSTPNNPVFPQTMSGGSINVGQLQLAFAPGLFCDFCNDVGCVGNEDPSTIDFNISPPADGCGVPFNAGANVDPICRVSMPGPMGSSAGCGGVCLGCGGEYATGNLCNFLSPSPSAIGLGDQPAAQGCGLGPLTPNYCKWASDPMSDPACACDTTCRAAEADFWTALVGCGPAPTQGTPINGMTCMGEGVAGVCRDLGMGYKQCAQCNDGGSCTKTITSGGIDSRYFEHDPQAITFEEGYDWPGCESITPENQEFCRKTNEDTPMPVTVPSTPIILSVTPEPPSQEVKKQPPTGPAPSDNESAQTSEVADRAPLDQRRNTSAGPGTDEITGRDAMGGHVPARLHAETGAGNGANPNQVETAKDGDPINLSKGSLEVVHTDLSFPGPVRALEFVRYYDSQSEDRSVLGSNWSHNFDMFVEAILPGNIPSWAPEYCIAQTPYITCAIVHYPGNVKRLFLRNPGDTNSLFYPQAGTTDTLRLDGQTWQLRRADGHAYLFNAYGYLVQDRDRFGNGFSIEYEPTPVYRNLQRYCRAQSSKPMQQGNAGLDVFATTQKNREDFDPRSCRLMAQAFGDEPEAFIDLSGWEPKTVKNGVTHMRMRLPLDEGLELAHANADYKALFNHVIDDYDYTTRWLNSGTNPLLPSGKRKLRPKRVIDDLDRTLVFIYHANEYTEHYGLISSVLGPEGIAQVNYEYSTPASYPVRLHEAFLTKVTRQDVSLGNPTEAGHQLRTERVIEFDYNWPSEGFESYDDGGYADLVELRYRNYFQTFVGCSWGGGSVCQERGGTMGFCSMSSGYIGGTSGITTCSVSGTSTAPGNACFLGASQRDQYISRVADNLVRITKNEIVEVESAYVVDPYHRSFDRITTQRYGGLAAADYGGAAAAQSANPGWASQYPEYTLTYVDAGPVTEVTGGVEVVSGDLTEVALPAWLQALYPLETAPAEAWQGLVECYLTGTCLDYTTPIDVQCDADTHKVLGGGSSSCVPNAHVSASLLLPEYRKSYKYFPHTDDLGPNPQLYRSRLTCEQLAAEHAGNPTANNVLQVLNQNIWERAQGTRDALTIDSRRICQWAKVVDREGSERYVGLNFRGQAIVDANQRDGSQYLINERLINADGMIMQERHSRPSTRAWSVADGHTDYTYDELNPNDEGGWNDWLPFWWMRRQNVTSVRVYPETYGGKTALTHEWAQGFSLDSDQLEYQELRFSYEPIFNQVRRVERFAKVASSTQPLSRDLVIYDFDYQELGLQSDELYDALLGRRLWGWRVPVGFRRGQAGHQAWLAWSLQVPFESEGTAPIDLNGDGHWGFPAFTQSDADRIAGFPVRMRVYGAQDPNDPTNRPRYTTLLWPNVAGRLAATIEPDQAHTIYQYYDRQHPYGPTTTTNSNNPHGSSDLSGQLQANSQQRGFLARIYKQRYVGYLPGDVPDAPWIQGTCEQLVGPLKWMLPAGCPAGGAVGAMTSLNIPSELQAELMDNTSPSGLEAWNETRFRYSHLGHVSAVRDEDQLYQFVRDTDGRLVTMADPLNQVTAWSYDGHDNVISKERRESSQQVAAAERYQYDAEGRVLTSCQEVTSGGCAHVVAGAVLAYEAPRQTVSPSYLLTTMRYTPEGQLWKLRDTMGIDTYYTYNEGGELVDEQVRQGSTVLSQTRYEYDDKGRHVLTKYGTDATRSSHRLGALNESIAYDGLGRVVTHVDVRGTKWHAAYTIDGQVSATGQGSSPYGLGAGSFNKEVLRAYDAHQRPIKQSSYNTMLTEYDYDSVGRLRWSESRPLGQPVHTGREQWFAYDAQGELVWSADQEGNQAVALYDARRRKAASLSWSVLSPGAGSASPQYQLQGQVDDLDVLGRVVLSETYGQQGEVQSAEAAYDALGYMAMYRNPEGKETLWTRNRVGWPQQVSEPVEQAMASILSSYTYNARGQVLSLVEPGQPGGTSTFTYDGLGRRTARRLPHHPSYDHERYYYDGYGLFYQLDRFDQGALKYKLRHRYTLASQGDLKTEVFWVGSPIAYNLARTTTQDRFGRLIEAKEYNQALTHTLGLSTAPDEVRLSLSYDELDRPVSQTQTFYNQGALQKILTTTQSHQVNASGEWEQVVTYPSQSKHRKTLDRLGRLALVETEKFGVQSVTGHTAQLHWQGAQYAGREQTYRLNPTSSIVPDPLKEVRQFDGLGRVTSLSYHGVEVDGSNQPLDAAWGAAYCKGTWSTACASPLLQLDLKYDVMDRVGSVRKRYGHPALDSQSQLMPLSAHRKQWHGYSYNPQGFLDKEWTSDQLSDTAHNSLQNHQVTPVALSQVGWPNGSGQRWDWKREHGVGDLLSIERADNTSVTRWKHHNASAQDHRLPGRRLANVEIDGQATKPILHDGLGRVTQDTEFEYVFDPFDRLVAARPIGQTTWSEQYHYDSLGRLSKLGGSDHPVPVFHAYDGAQMIAAYEQNTLVWEALWADQLDHLLQWRHAPTSTVYLPLRDHRNTIVALHNANTGEVSHLADVDAQGRTTTLFADETVNCQEQGQPGTVCALGDIFPFGLNTAWRSQTTGMLSMRHRWYSPTLGQFVSHDPYEYIDSFNLYAFAALDPINNWDPWGLKSEGTADKVKQFGKGFVRGFFGVYSKQGEELADELMACAKSPEICLDIRAGIEQLGRDAMAQAKDTANEVKGAVECIEDPNCRGGVPKAAKEDAEQQIQTLKEKTPEELGEMGGGAAAEALQDGVTKIPKIRVVKPKRGKLKKKKQAPPERDGSGRVHHHGEELPDRIPKHWTKEELIETERELSEGLKARKEAHFEEQKRLKKSLEGVSDPEERQRLIAESERRNANHRREETRHEELLAKVRKRLANMKGDTWK